MCFCIYKQFRPLISVFLLKYPSSFLLVYRQGEVQVGMCPLPEHGLVAAVLANKHLCKGQSQWQFAVSLRATEHQGMRYSVAAQHLSQSGLYFSLAYDIVEVQYILFAISQMLSTALTV